MANPVVMKTEEMEMDKTQYTLIKLPVKEIINQNFNVSLSREYEIQNEYLIAQSASLLFDQIFRLRKTDKNKTSAPFAAEVFICLLLRFT